MKLYQRPCSSIGENPGGRASIVFVDVQFLLLVYNSETMVGFVCTCKRLALRNLSARFAWIAGIHNPGTRAVPHRLHLHGMLVYHWTAFTDLASPSDSQKICTRSFVKSSVDVPTFAFFYKQWKDTWAPTHCTCVLLCSLRGLTREEAAQLQDTKVARVDDSNEAAAIAAYGEEDEEAVVMNLPPAYIEKIKGRKRTGTRWLAVQTINKQKKTGPAQKAEREDPKGHGQRHEKVTWAEVRASRCSVNEKRVWRHNINCCHRDARSAIVLFDDKRIQGVSVYIPRSCQRLVEM